MTSNGLKDACDMGGVRCSTVYPEKFSRNGSIWKSGNYEDDMCQIDGNDDLMFKSSVKFGSMLHSNDCNKVAGGPDLCFTEITFA
jgi:hypothetical protein